MTCPYCEGTGRKVIDLCTNRNPDCDGTCDGCIDRYDVELCYACDGIGDISEEYYKELKYEE
jgi:hypothetical protein